MPDTGAPFRGAHQADEIGGVVLDTLFRQSAVGLHILDTELRVVRVNALSHVAAPERIVGLHFTEAYRLDDPERSEELLRRVLETGVPVLDHMVRGEVTGVPGPDRSLTVTVHRLESADGRPLGLLAAVIDVDEREKSRARVDALGVVRENVDRSLDMATICEGFVEALVPRFADIAEVEVVDELLHGTTAPLSPVVPGVTLRRAARTGKDGAASAGETRRLPEATPHALAAHDLEPRLVRLGRDTPWLHADPAAGQVVSATGAHSLIVAPLHLHGAFLGLVNLYRCPGREPFDERDVVLALTAAAHLALSIETSRRYGHDHVIASTVQRRLLPQRDDPQMAVGIAHTLLPGRNSGCWFDTIGLPGARTALVIGDVAGHGLQTAVTMGQLRTALHALAALDLGPDEILAHLDDTADRLAQERRSLPPGDALHRQPLAATCLYAVYDPFTRTCTMARAGHPAPLAVDPAGRPVVLDVPEGPPLFSDDSAPFALATVELDEGSVLAFFTGSLMPDDRAVAGARATLARPDRPLQELCDALVYSLPAEAHPDGAALLLARTGVVPPDRAATWELPHDRTAPAAARGLVRDRLRSWGLGEETIEATELIVSELVTNAVRYGTPPLRLRLLRGSTLTCEIHDSSPLTPRLRHARTVDEGGRGLFIVSQLATHWGTRYDTDGKTLWAEQELRAGDNA
ncbi:SpoIIE family protein phosphatase [Streptomyces sp. NPDC006367]|uniref:SpoIIE family protein phosphatase n=1 Tax=unclassified Streptomyces TaxID=2593676 RepID=UPI0033BE9CFF